jgi:hypothetical protein
MKQDAELIWEAYTSSKKKYGDIVPAIEIADLLNVEVSTFTDWGTSSIDHYFDPTSGGGGQQEQTLYDAKFSEFAKGHNISSSYLATFFESLLHNLFIPKCKILSDIALNPTFQSRYKRSPEEMQQLKEARNKAQELFPYVGIALTPESYRLLVGDSWDKLPECVIGNTEWDWSFHGGEGRVESFIAAIGKTEKDVRQKLKAALGVLRAEYVGSGTEARFQQRYKVREGD